MRLYLSDENAGDHRLYGSEPGRRHVDVEVVRLDDVLGTLPNLGFVKIDVQGFELPALEGLRKNLENSRRIAVLSEFWPRGMRLAGQDPDRFLDFMESMSFSYQVVDKTLKALRSLSRSELMAECERLGEVDLWWQKL